WEKIPIARNATIEEVIHFGAAFIKSSLVEVLAHGNISKDRALSVSRSIKSYLESEVKSSSFAPLRVIKLEKKSSYVYVPTPIENPNCAVEIYFQIGKMDNPMDRVLTELVSHIFNEPFFDILRTKEQLGYIV